MPRALRTPKVWCVTLALGARAVLIGRPIFWGLAVEGETGVRMVLEMLRDELDATTGMCGRTTVASVDRACLVGVSPLLALLPQVAPFHSRAEADAALRRDQVTAERERRCPVQ
jgi:FMN-dependent dehydrogenase